MLLTKSQGWGTSFHFARMFKDSTFKECISRHEDFLALKLNLKPGMKCLDVGCGVGNLDFLLDFQLWIINSDLLHLRRSSP